jgi:hypothetical protein
MQQHDALALLAIVLIIVGFVLISVGKWGGLLVIGCGIIIAFLWRRLTNQTRASNLAITQRIAGAQENFDNAVLLNEAQENLYNAQKKLNLNKNNGLNDVLAGTVQKKIDKRQRAITTRREQLGIR